MWLNTKGSAYVTEMSDGPINTNGAVECPQCGMTIQFCRSYFTAHKDRENDITHWDGTHGCGAKLTIFND